MESTQARPSVPAWAYLSPKHQGCEMRRGDELESGDIVYFSLDAYPRVLWTKVTDDAWSVSVQKPNMHFKQQVTINPQTYYLTRRVGTSEPIDRLRVDGYSLAAGDVVAMGLASAPYRAVIEVIDDPTIHPQRGTIRRAAIRRTDTNEAMPFIFGGFSLRLFDVASGPKLDAARKNPKLVKASPTGWVWIGGTK